MDITGVEVIRANGIEVVPGQKVTLTYGERLRIDTRFEYRSSSPIDVTLRGAIGNRRLSLFDTVIEAEAEPRRLPAVGEFAAVTATVEVPITSDIAPRADYDIQVTLKEFPEAGAPEVPDVIDITGVAPTLELLEETIYHFAYIFQGEATYGTFTFRTDPFTPVNWVSGRLARAVEEEIRKTDNRILEMRVYVDRSPLLWTDWRIEVVLAEPTPEGSIGLVGWVVAILVALSILILVITYSVKEVVKLFRRRVGLEDMKPTWGKKALILDIQDSEDYFERTPTPVATLEGMSEEELRELLDEIAEQEIKPGVSGLALALVAGAVVVGVVALSRRPTAKRLTS